MKTLPKISQDMILFMAEEKNRRKKEAEEMPVIREGVLTGLLIDVAEVFNVNLRTILSGDQQELTVFVRLLFYYVARCKTDYGMQVLVETAGKKNHTGVIHHLDKVRAYFKDNNTEFLALWNHYLTNSKLFTEKDFPNEQTKIPG